MEFKSLAYFQKLPKGPYNAIDAILNDNEHAVCDLLNEDINNIDNEELEEYCLENNIDQLLSRANNKNFEAKKWFLEYKLGRKIASKRLEILKNSSRSERPDPFDRENLKLLEVDVNGLTELRNFDCSNSGVTLGNIVYQICPSLDQYDSSLWLSNLLFNETFRNNKNFKVRIDPLVEVPIYDYQPNFKRMNLYGTKLNWDELKLLRNENFGQWLGGGLSTPSIKTTDYVWRPDEKEIHFTYEEIPKQEYINIRGGRYFHAIFDKKSGQIVHCDGAIRIYEKEEFEKREKYHVRQPEVRKIGTRIKIFQIDDYIDQSLFLRLATNFLVWNEDAIKYFNES